MVQVTQTEDEIKIVVELNRLLTRKPDIILMPFYIKFNNPPIFFERHLADEIDEGASFCRIFKTEARIILIKRNKGIWPKIFLTLSKEELFQKRLEISNQTIEKNKEMDQQAIERYDQKRRSEIDKEVRRDSALRERVKTLEEDACREALLVGVRKETHEKQLKKEIKGSQRTQMAIRPMATIRSAGKINVNFSNFNLTTPKRESQQLSEQQQQPSQLNADIGY